MNVVGARKCSVTHSARLSLTQRHVLMLTTLAQHKAMTGQQLRALFFRSTRKCQLHVAHLKRLGLLHEVAGLPRPERGSAPRVYAVTGAGARIVAGASNLPGPALRKRTQRVGNTDLHLRHTVAVNDFFTRLHTAVQAQGGSLQWLGEAACRAHYADARGQRPTLTPDGAGTLWLGAGETRFFLELDRNTERRAWLLQKYRRYLRHLAGRVGAERLHVLFVLPDRRRERVLHDVGRVALRGTAVPAPGFWTASQEVLAGLGPLGVVWARVPGDGATRVTLPGIGGVEVAAPEVPLSAR
jgi:hypothetical protein